MTIGAAGAGQVPGTAGTFAPALRRSSPARILPRPADGAAQRPGAMRVDGWFDLAVPAPSSQAAAAGAALNLQPQPGNIEEIIVQGRRLHDAAEDIAPTEPMYEAAQSDSAQRLYAAGPIWYSPEQVRLMSTAKEALGLCGGLGGLLTCPDR